MFKQSEFRPCSDIDVKLIHDVTVIQIPNKFFDTFTAKTFRQEVIKLCEQKRAQFLIDMSRVEFIDSAGLGVLILLYKAVGNNGKLALFGVQKKVDDILVIANIKKLLPSFENLEQALRYFPVSRKK